MPYYNPNDTLLDKYRIETFLGQGAFAEVYHVTHLGLNAPRAVKLLHRDMPGVGSSDYNDCRQRFQLEAQLGARLDHPHIIRVHDVEQVDDALLLVMEYASGGSLADRLTAHGPLPVGDALRMACELAEGLAALHALDAVHRDLKPSNILFDAQGRAKVADLGLAQIPHGPSDRSQQSVPLPHPGTPAYMSPEQRDTREHLTPASDIYALGAVLFEALTGRVYRSQRPGTDARALRPDVPASTAALLTRMLDKDPESRPWDGAETGPLLQAEETAYRQWEAEEAERKHMGTQDAVPRQPAEKEAERKQREAGDAAPRQREVEESVRKKREAQEMAPKQHKAADVARKQQEIAEATRSQQEIAQLQQSYQRLSVWNLLDHLRLLLWVLVVPQHLKTYRDIFGEDDEHRVGKWLTSALMWAPLLLLTVMMAIKRTALAGIFSTAWFSIGAVLIGLNLGWIVWLFEILAKKTESIASLTLTVWTVVGFVVAGGMTVGVVYEVGNILGIVVVVMPVSVSLGVLFGIAVLSEGYYEIFIDALGVLFGTAIGVSLGVAISGGSRIAVGFWGVVVLVVTGSVAFVVDENFETGKSSHLARLVFGALVLSYALLVWFCFLGGWRTFS